MTMKTTRRTLMLGAAGLSFAVALDGPAALAATVTKGRAGKALSPWASTTHVTAPAEKCQTNEVRRQTDASWPRNIQ